VSVCSGMSAEELVAAGDHPAHLIGFIQPARQWSSAVAAG
jgi:hypothetical protein